MAQATAIVVLVLASFLGVLGGTLVWRRRRKQSLQAAAQRARTLPRVPLRSQVIELPSRAPEASEARGVAHVPAEPAPALPHALDVPLRDPMLDVHQAPTREFAAHIEALAALTTEGTPTRALVLPDAQLRELSASDEHVLAPHERELELPEHSGSGRARVASDIQPRVTLSPREQDATLKVGAARAREARAGAQPAASNSSIVRARGAALERETVRVRRSGR